MQLKLQCIISLPSGHTSKDKGLKPPNRIPYEEFSQFKIFMKWLQHHIVSLFKEVLQVGDHSAT